MDKVDLILKIKEQKLHLVLYIQSKLAAEDWHAVSDAANDIRELEAQLEILENL